MSLFNRFFKVVQSGLHAIIKRFEDPVKLLEQGIRDLKHDFDENIKSVAEVKAIAIGTRKQLEAKTQIAKDYEQKALIILKKGQNGELDKNEADRLATEALKKQKMALDEVRQLTQDSVKFDTMLNELENKSLEIKNKIQQCEKEYQSLKARATVAKTTKRINKQLSTISNDSTMAMIEDMKTRIQEEENLAEAYGQLDNCETNIDDEINEAIGTDMDVQNSLNALKQQLLETSSEQPQALTDDLEKLKKELDS